MIEPIASLENVLRIRINDESADAGKGDCTQSAEKQKRDNPAWCKRVVMNGDGSGGTRQDVRLKYDLGGKSRSWFDNDSSKGTPCNRKINAQ
jgi:hypothetical protein